MRLTGYDSPNLPTNSGAVCPQVDVVFQIAVIGGKYPVTGMFNIFMFDRVIVNVINVVGIVAVVADGVFPETALPDASFMAIDVGGGETFSGRKVF